MRIKAASISYAVFMAVLTALFCYGLVLVFSLNTNLEDHYRGQSKLLAEQYSAQAYAQANFHQFPREEWTFVSGTSDGIRQGFKKSAWGMLYTMGVQTLGFKDTISEHYLLAPQMNAKAPTLYLKDQDDPLKLSGSTTVEGLIACAKKQVTQLRINSSTQMEINQTGPVVASQSRLPEYKLRDLESLNDEAAEFLDSQVVEYHQSFDQPLAVYIADSYLSEVRLSGKILIKSEDTLHIASTAELKDVVVQAPKIVVEANFKGSAQLLAAHEIVLEANSFLQFPSVLMLTEATGFQNRIQLEADAMVQGAIYLPEAKSNLHKPTELLVEADAQVLGHIFCGGTLELYGDVTGKIVASQLLYQTQTTKHSNLLKDVELLVPEQPGWLFALNESAETPAVILKKL